MTAPFRALVLCLTCLVAPPIGWAAVGRRGVAWAWGLVPALWLLAGLGPVMGIFPVLLYVPAVYLCVGLWAVSVVVVPVLAWRRPSLADAKWSQWAKGAAATLLYGGFALVLMGLVAWVSGSAIVKTAAMAPSMYPGDVVLLAEGPMVGTPQVGDVVRYDPDATNKPDGPRWQRRVVAVAGQRVEVVGDELRVDGVVVTTGPSQPAQRVDRTTCKLGAADQRVEALGGKPRPIWVGGRSQAPIVVPSDHVYVLGDDRVKSLDSRHKGPVSISSIDGRVVGLARPSAHCGAFAWNRWGSRP